MGTNWQSDTVADVDPFELSDEPNREVYWYDAVHTANSSEASRARQANRARSTPLAELVSGQYWSRSVIESLSFNRAWIGNKTANAYRSVGLHDPGTALAMSVNELSALGIRIDAIVELIASACLPPKRVHVRWMSLGECLHQLLAFDLQQYSYSPVTALSIDAANWRFLRRNGVSSITRLLFSHPDQLLLLRGFGHIRFSKLVGSLLLFDSPVSQPAGVMGRWAEPAVPLEEWFQLKVHKPQQSVITAAADMLLQDSSDPYPTKQLIKGIGLLQLSEKALSTHRVGPRGFLQAMSLLSDEFSNHSIG